MKLTETNRTLIYVGVAILSVGAASLTHYATRPREDKDYANVGSEFYKDFQDPTAAQVLRVVAYDKDTASIKEFKVEYRDGKWQIPSHHNYPADGKDRLARTAASVIGTSRVALVSRLKSDQARYDVIDPEDPDATILTGRGQKITIAKSDGTVLAEFVIGKKAEGPGQTDVYYVRGTKTDDSNGIYLAKLKIDLSTKFSDWIEPDLLKVDRDKLTDVKSDNYSIDEVRGAIVKGEVTELSRKTSSDPWKLVGMNDSKEELKTAVVNQVVNNLDSLRLVGVRPKPRGINPDLSIDKRLQEVPELVMRLKGDMAARGFYVGSDRRGGPERIFSKEGEFEAGTSDGLRYTLRFGQIFTGTEFDIETGLTKNKKDGKSEGDKKSPADSKGASPAAADKAKEPVKKGRYLMVYTTFDPKLLGEPPAKPSEPKKPNGVVQNVPSPASPSKPDKAGKHDDSQMLALAFADAKTEKAAETKTGGAKPAGGKDAPGKTSPSAKQPAAAKANPSPVAKPASTTKQQAPAKPAALPAKPDPKAEYQKAMDKYKQDMTRYDNDKSEYEKKIKQGQDKVKELNERFGPWYYVISAESFENLRLTHAGLVKPKESPAKKDTGETKGPAAAPVN